MSKLSIKTAIRNKVLRNVTEDQQCKAACSTEGNSLQEDFQDRHQLDKIAREFENYCQKNHLYVNECHGVEQVPGRAGFVYWTIFDGDWKHEHLRSVEMFKLFCEEFGYSPLFHSEELIGESDSDCYTAEHQYGVIYYDNSSFNESLRKLTERYVFSLVDEAIDHFRNDLGIEPDVDEVIDYIERTTTEAPQDPQKYSDWYSNIACEISARLNEGLELPKKSLNEEFDVFRDRDIINKKNQQFYSYNGFNQSGTAYIVLGNTYPIKDELKSKGAKFNNYIKAWILPEYDAQYMLDRVDVNELYRLRPDGTYHWTIPSDDIDEIAGKVQSINLQMQRDNNTSEFQGNIGDKIVVDPVVKCEFAGSYSSAFGQVYIYKFWDKDDNIYVWKTGYQDPETTFTKIIGTVKAHEEFRGEKQTVLTRCKLLESKTSGNIVLREEHSEDSFWYNSDVTDEEAEFAQTVHQLIASKRFDRFGLTKFTVVKKPDSYVVFCYSEDVGDADIYIPFIKRTLTLNGYSVLGVRRAPIMNNTELVEIQFNAPVSSQEIQSSVKVPIQKLTAMQQPAAPVEQGSNKVLVKIINDGPRLRARGDDGVNGSAWVAFPNALRTTSGATYQVDALSYNGKNYTVKGHIYDSDGTLVK